MIKLSDCIGKRVLIGDDSYETKYTEAKILTISKNGFVKIKWIESKGMVWIPRLRFESDWHKYSIVDILEK